MWTCWKKPSNKQRSQIVVITKSIIHSGPLNKFRKISLLFDHFDKKIWWHDCDGYIRPPFIYHPPYVLILDSNNILPIYLQQKIGWMVTPIWKQSVAENKNYLRLLFYSPKNNINCKTASKYGAAGRRERARVWWCLCQTQWRPFQSIRESILNCLLVERQPYILETRIKKKRDQPVKPWLEGWIYLALKMYGNESSGKSLSQNEFYGNVNELNI